MANAPSIAGLQTLSQELPDTELPCRGQLPQWLGGELLRTGPAQFEVGGERYRHWFDGLAMLHKFRFLDGRVIYSNRFLQSNTYREAKAAGAVRRPEFATNPRPTLLQRVLPFTRPDSGDNGNVNTSRLGPHTVALTETPHPVAFDPNSLETLPSEALRPSLPGQITTAHPQFDFERNCQYNYLLEFGRVSQYHLYRIAADSTQPEVVATIKTQRPAYMHSFGMSQRYLVLTEFPLVANPLSFLLGSRPFIENYRWKPERGTLFHVIDKDTGELVQTARAEPFFAFHHVNAFEQDSQLHVDIVVFPDASVIGDLYLDRLRSGTPIAAGGQLKRFTLDLTKNVAVESRLLAEGMMELPRFDYRNRSGQPYRYVYAAGMSPGSTFFDKLSKVDLEKGETATWHEAGCYPGEPVFVSSPEQGEEDGGAILSVVLDANAGHSFLLVLNAADLSEHARIDVPHAIPFGFHGNFFKTP